MKDLRITTELDPALVPPFYSIVGPSEPVTELRAIDWNLAGEDFGTVLYAVDGDATTFREAATETDGIDRVVTSDVETPATYVIVEARPTAIPFFSTFMALTARAGMIVRKPIVYADGKSFGRVVGESAPLQAALDETPGEIDVQIEVIGRFPSDAEDRSIRLSDRQREAVETALALGYYDQPRKATHEDVGAELGIAANTVSEHLQKAEAKLVRAVIDSRGRPGTGHHGL